jgi:hypothetical protein
MPAPLFYSAQNCNVWLPDSQHTFIAGRGWARKGFPFPWACEGLDALNTSGKDVLGRYLLPRQSVLCGVELPTRAAYGAQWDCAAAGMDNSVKCFYI